ncbi:MAG: TraB/GumN family protein [Cryomorphaceae bacterium]|nr:TraB/GumN family protein [Cryomorphaceae bacterium]
MIRCSFLICTLLTFLQTFSQETIPFPMDEQALLWKIEKKGMEKPSYLFGTIHLIEKEYFFFPDKLQKLVEKSDQLIMELAGIPSQQEALKHIQLKEGVFFDYFSVEQSDSILRWAKEELHMNDAQFRGVMTKMKPFVAVQLATQMHYFGKTESYEMTLEELAKKNEIPIKGLETVEEQMSLFDELSKEAQSEMVMEIVRNPKEQYESTQKIEQLYARQQVDSLYMLIVDSGGTIASENARFIDDRNVSWIPLIEELIREKRTFIAVGAGHLGGPNGVIRLLQQKGYTLTPIKL